MNNISITDEADVMKAALYFKHGDTRVVSVIENYPIPEVKSGQALVKVLAASLNARDPKLIANAIPEVIIPTPKVIGSEFCGVVISTQNCKTDKLKVGDKVIAMLDLLYNNNGAVAEYVAVNEKDLVHAPLRLSAIESASIPLVGLTIMQAMLPYLRSIHQQSANKRVLIQGGSGGLGSFAIQYCKRVLCMHVTTTCNTEHVEYVRGLGADTVIDYTAQSFLDRVSNCDVVLDSKAYLYEKVTLNSNVLKQDGWYIHIAASPNQLVKKDKDPLRCSIPESRLDRYLANTWKQFYHNKVVRIFKPHHFHYSYVFVKPNPNQLAVIASYYTSGDIEPSALNVFPMDTEGVQGALAQMESGHTRGKVVIKIAENF